MDEKNFKTANEYIEKRKQHYESKINFIRELMARNMMASQVFKETGKFNKNLLSAYKKKPYAVSVYSSYLIPKTNDGERRSNGSI